MARKVKSLRGYVIAETTAKERATGKNDYEIYTNDEWNCGEGYRYPDHDAGSIAEAEEFIKGGK